MAKQYDTLGYGELWQISGRVAVVACCDCALVHEIKFRITKTGKIQMRWYRDDRRTKEQRKARKKK